MLQKNLTLKIIALLSIITLVFTSCKKEENRPHYEGVNTLTLSYANSTQKSVTMIPFTNQSVTVNLTLTTSLSKDLIVDITIPNANSLLSITPNKLTIPAGKKTASCVIAVQNEEVAQSKELQIVATTNDPKIKTTTLSITVSPEANSNFSAHELSLIHSYIKNKNFDVRPLLGTWTCAGTITSYEGDLTAPKAAEQITNQTTTISLSPLATEDKIVLAMTNNAFGLNSYFEGVYTRRTILNTESWANDDVAGPKYICEKIGFTKTSKETYNVAYLNMGIDVDPQTHTPSIHTPFLETINQILATPGVNPLNANGANIEYTNSGDDDLYFPFIYEFSVWNKCLEYLKAHPDDDTFKENIPSSNISPYQILDNSVANKDAWEGETDNPTNYSKPSLTLDMAKKQIKLVLSRDSSGSFDDSGYTTLNITLTKLEK